MPPAPSELARTTREYVARTCSTIFARYWTDPANIPSHVGGYRVTNDFAIDAAYTLSYLARAGVTTLHDGRSIESVVAAVLGQLDGDRVTTFYSYRAAETLLAFGGLQGPIAKAFSVAQREQFVRAVDSTSIYDPAKRDLVAHPSNYWAVLARCEHGRRALGLDATLYDVSVERVRGLLARNPLGYFDDTPRGEGRYDIYSPDVMLFLEPLWTELGEADMRSRLAAHVSMMDAIVDERSGATVCWGRSIGALSLCATLELAGHALRLGIGNASRMLQLAHIAFAAFRRDWMRDDLISAHRDRAPYSYRGPARLLQMTFDCLGKLAAAAESLDHAIGEPTADSTTPARESFIRFESDRHAAVWAVRTPTLSFQLPFVSGEPADYVASPKWPGTFDSPTESRMPALSPRVIVGGEEFQFHGLPLSLSHSPGIVEARFDVAHNIDPKSPVKSLSVRRDVTWQVVDDALTMVDRLQFDAVPESIYVCAYESDEPLQVTFRVNGDSAEPRVAPVSGQAAMRSYFASIQKVYEITVEPPSREVTIETTVRRSIRVWHNPIGHDYNRTVYDAMPRSAVAEFGDIDAASGARISRVFDAISQCRPEIIHIGWPEHLLAQHGVDDATFDRQFVEMLAELRKQTGAKLLWTMHNRRPHAWPRERGRALYASIAPLVDAAIHHSRWGEQLIRAELPYRSDCIHAVIPHAHFGDAMRGAPSRDQLEAKFGLKPCAMRFGIIGRWQPEKQIEMMIRAFHAAARPDQQLVLTAYREDTDTLADDRIVKLPRKPWMERSEIAEYVGVCDAMLCAHTGDTYLTTGVPADALGMGQAVIANGWQYFREHCGDALIEHDGSEAGVARRLASLTPSELATAWRAAAGLRDVCSPSRVAALTLVILQQLTGRSRVN
jgi:glycosyltransferase involved in cell wall biosynthesis